MAHGIAPATLFKEVESTSAWALVPGYTQASYQQALLDLKDAPESWHTAEHRPRTFRSRVAAHFTTCAGFCPTDVDNQIRFHVWQEVHTPEALQALLDVAAEAFSWPIPEVSEKYITVDGRILSGHAGEWFTIRAGALGRAHALGSEEHIAQLRAEIDEELDFEMRTMKTLAKTYGREREAIIAVAALAHNFGDLARVCEAWPVVKTDAFEADRARYTEIPKQQTAIADAYKDLLADSCHRYLALRPAKSLRARRDFLMPTPPFLEAWGEYVGRHSKDDERIEILSALLEGHSASPTERGFLRAIAGMNQGLKGGVDAYERDLPARLRKTLRAGAIRPALDLDARRFEERMKARFVSHWKSRLCA